jgi:uncharacterized protein YndB with AHSA1/START domain
MTSVTVTRTFDAPRELVFDAWTDPKHLTEWWGPHGFTNPRCEFDARPGGVIRIDMRGPNGVVYPMTGTVTEIRRPERLAFTTQPIDENGNVLFETVVDVTFIERAGKTTVTVVSTVTRMVAPQAAQMIAGMEQGWTQSLERLEEHVRDIV